MNLYIQLMLLTFSGWSNRHQQSLIEYVEQAPKRGKGTSWATFIGAHKAVVAAADFFTVEVVRPFGLVRYYVLFVIDIGSRGVHIAGISSQPSGVWMSQIAHNLTNCIDGFLRSRM